MFYAAEQNLNFLKPPANTMEAPEAVFDTMSDAIAYAFRHEQTSLLSLDRICHVLLRPNLYLRHKSDGTTIPCSSLTRRRISSTLSSSDVFMRAGPPRTCVWALRPNNPLFLSDGAIAASIENILTRHGPIKLDQFATLTDLQGADAQMYEAFITEHPQEYERGDDGRYWFAGQKHPSQGTYESINQALVAAFREFPEGASVEQLHWFLCLSTVGGTKAITRRSVSRELSRRSDLFVHCARARYRLIERENVVQIPPKVAPREMFPAPRVPVPAVPVVRPFHVPSPPDFPPMHVEPFQMEAPVAPAFHIDGPAVTGFQFPQPVVDMSPVEVHRTVQDEEDFNPFSFFGNDFQFAYE